MKEVQKNFDAFVIQRQNTLNLKLECSGFWSAYIDELHDHPLADEFQYVCILRPPSSWIRSVVNHWVKIKKDMRYDYINELFWKQKVGVDLHQIPNLEGEAQNEQVKILEDFYFDYTNKTRKLDNVDYVWLSQIEEYLPVLNQKIDEVGDPGKSWKRGRSYKVFTYENEALDAEYEKLTSAFHMAIPK
ncbi:hypothetical protein BST99_05480 [Aureicoccus marinus]|uniref:Sulfotransferase family protein n=1 Tax=Aureicoccus marinus TaxID=754435 RepID=A0A2S7T5Q1_9FLAO|nr:hypothetical protein BST99_05480 [Aureicoccus marinus]